MQQPLLNSLHSSGPSKPAKSPSSRLSVPVKRARSHPAIARREGIGNRDQQTPALFFAQSGAVHEAPSRWLLLCFVSRDEIPTRHPHFVILEGEGSKSSRQKRLRARLAFAQKIVFQRWSCA